MDNGYFTENIAPKKPASEAARDTQQGEQHGRRERREHSDQRRDYGDRRRSQRRSDAPRPVVSEDGSTTTEIIGVRFKDVGKVYYFSPQGIAFSSGERVIVETSRGVECGEVVLSNREYPVSGLVSPLKKILRKADEDDIKQAELTRQKEREIFEVFTRKIREHKLEMKPIEVECTFDGSKILFYFTSDGRVDFRELVKDLASIYRTRIELRQIGVRDEAKMLGGLGICGRPFCCSSFLGDFQPVSIKMAKEQSLSLNPTKISGTCGRLMCCLKYEQDAYEDLLRTTPKTGAYVETPDGRGVVIEVNLITGVLKVKLDKKPDMPISVNKADVKLLKDAQIRLNRDEIKALRGLED